MIVSEDVLFNVLKDWQKRDISPYDKGVLIQAYLFEKKISQRQLARDLDIHHTTLHTWISFAKNLEPGQYEELVEKGLPKEQIYEVARAKFKGNNGVNVLDVMLSRLVFVISKNDSVSDVTVERAKRVIVELQRIVDSAEKKGKVK